MGIGRPAAWLPAALLAFPAGCSFRIAYNEAIPDASRPIIYGREAATGDELDEDDTPGFDEFWGPGTGMDLVLDLGAPRTLRWQLRCESFSFTRRNNGYGELGDATFQAFLIGFRIGGSSGLWWESYVSLAGGFSTLPAIDFNSGAGDFEFTRPSGAPAASAAVGLNISLGKLAFYAEYEILDVLDGLPLTSEAEAWLADPMGPDVIDATGGQPLVVKVNLGLRLGW